MLYTLEFRPSVLQKPKRLPQKLDELAADLPDPSTTKLKGNNPFHKIRFGDFRIIYGDFRKLIKQGTRH